ncbi:MAG: FecR family protein [Cyanobacteria bacterium J06626_18]
MSKYHFRWVGFASFLYTAASTIAPLSVSAEVPLTRASVESLQNRVELLLQTGATYPVRPTDWLSSGDTIQTADDARADLRFNDGSFARIGEEAAFYFTQDTRTFHLANGTVLFLIPPEKGASIVETPNAVTQFRETALVVRYISPENSESATHRLQAVQGDNNEAGRTVVMVLTDHPEEPVEVSLPDGRMTNLAAGQMAIVDGSEIFVFEFDLALFYETSTLVEGLHLDDPDYAGSGEPTDVVREETLEGLANQRSFEGEYVLDPDFLNSEATSVESQGTWLVPLETEPSTHEGEAAAKPSTDITVPLTGKVSPEAFIEDAADLVPEDIEEDAAAPPSDGLPPLVNNPPESVLLNDAELPDGDSGLPGEDPVDPVVEPPVVEPPLTVDPIDDPTVQGPVPNEEATQDHSAPVPLLGIPEGEFTTPSTP